MTKPMIRIHDTAIDEIIDREMTDDEFAVYQINVAKADELKVEENFKAEAKAAAQAKLAALGLTVEDLTALGL